MSEETGGPAFPGFDYIDQYGKKNPEGMTLRDYFASKILQGFLASPHLKPLTADSEVCTAAYMMADAMLKARSK